MHIIIQCKKRRTRRTDTHKKRQKKVTLSGEKESLYSAHVLIIKRSQKHRDFPDVGVLLVLECIECHECGHLGGGDLLGEFCPVNARNCNPSRSHLGEHCFTDCHRSQRTER